MKKIIFLTVLVGIFFVGCQDSNVNPVSPLNANMSISALPDNTPVTLDKIDFSSMKLSKWNGLYNKLYNASGHSVLIKNTIAGSTGGSVKLNPYNTNTSYGNTATVSGDVTFSKNAINGNQDIYMVVDPDNATVTFYPDISQFNGDVTVNATIQGIDLTDLASDSSPLKFVYVPDDPNADVQVITTSGITLDKNTGTVSVTGAQLKHFSRYAWAH